MQFNRNKLYQTEYEFGNQFCQGYNNTTANQYCIFKDETHVFVFFCKLTMYYLLHKS